MHENMFTFFSSFNISTCFLFSFFILFSFILVFRLKCTSIRFSTPLYIFRDFVFCRAFSFYHFFIRFIFFSFHQLTIMTLFELWKISPHTLTSITRMVHTNNWCISRYYYNNNTEGKAKCFLFEFFCRGFFCWAHAYSAKSFRKVLNTFYLRLAHKIKHIFLFLFFILFVFFKCCLHNNKWNHFLHFSFYLYRLTIFLKLSNYQTHTSGTHF